MERPGLKALLDDIEAGLIDIVIVYKVDRLTRSLSDFAKIIEVLDQHGVSFVAVTQQFNTTSSMGRLTLNILLSFAQFEREVTGERIRDKIAASKRKGMWMGGFSPLGYDGEGRTLVINQEEAETVRTIFQLYNSIGTVLALKLELERRGVTSKRRLCATGRTFGGDAIGKSGLYVILSNPVYIGQIRHKGICHPGLHSPIIERALWDDTQALLERNRQGNKDRRTSSKTAVLLDRLFDAQGERLVPTFTIKKGRRYRYYTSHFLHKRKEHQRLDDGWRLPAPSLEETISSSIKKLFDDHAELAAAWHRAKLPFAQYQKVIASLKASKAPAPFDLIERVEVSDQGLAVTIAMASLTEGCSNLVHHIPMRFRRRGREMRLVLDNQKRQVDQTLLSALARSHSWFNELITDTVGMAEIAEREGVSKGRVSQISRLAFLSPKIVQAVMQGSQPAELTTRVLLGYGNLPLSWAEQEALVGI